MKSMKRANGSGSVYKLSGRRRRPWIAAVTIGWEDGKQRRKLLGSYSTQDEALAMLLRYNGLTESAPVSEASLSFAQLWQRWIARRFPELSASARRVYRAAYHNSRALHDVPFANISVDTLERCITGAGVGYQSARTMKNLYNQLYQYAIPRGLANVNQAQYIDIKLLQKSWEENRTTKRVFTENEIAALFADAAESDLCKGVCMLLYSGLRISEFLNLKKSDCHLSEHWIDIRNAKTPAGIRRVPIADKTYPFWEYFYRGTSAPDGYLFRMDGRTYEGRKGYDAFYGRSKSPWKRYFLSHGRHTVHETRHSCETMLRRAEVYSSKIDAIIGHAGSGVGERVYTHLEISDLLPEINKI